MTLSKTKTLESSRQGSRAVRIDRFGGPEVFRPQRGEGEPVDYKIRSGKYPAVTKSQSSRADETIREPERGHQQHHGRIRASSGRKDRCGENIEVRDGEGSQILVYDRLG
jgi:hypothetical protein